MRLFLASLLVSLLAAIPATPAEPPAEGAEKDRVKMDKQTKDAVDKALRWLKDQQNADGSWGNTTKTAMTSFAMLALMANGNVPNEGTYGPEVSKGVRYLLACSREVDGYLLGPSGGNMYCHGMATLALTQAFGMTGDPDVKKVLKKAVNLIVKTQNHEGGWRYDPSPTGADISVTIMQVMALRGAKDSGLAVPDKTIKNAIGYINKCYDKRSGGYRYQPYSSGPGFARTAAGLCVIYLGGEEEIKKHDKDELRKSFTFMERVGDDRQHYWYGHYYAAHAINQVGGEMWERYYARMKQILLASQKSSGEWYERRREAAYGPVYQTAIAVLILSVPTHYLPIYQK